MVFFTDEDLLASLDRKVVFHGPVVPRRTLSSRKAVRVPQYYAVVPGVEATVGLCMLTAEAEAPAQPQANAMDLLAETCF